MNTQGLYCIQLTEQSASLTPALTTPRERRRIYVLEDKSPAFGSNPRILNQRSVTLPGGGSISLNVYTNFGIACFPVIDFSWTWQFEL